jgi:hypothetical protein
LITNDLAHFGAQKIDQSNRSFERRWNKPANPFRDGNHEDECSEGLVPAANLLLVFQHIHTRLQSPFSNEVESEAHEVAAQLNRMTCNGGGVEVLAEPLNQLVEQWFCAHDGLCGKESTDCRSSLTMGFMVGGGVDWSW